ncbi:MAG: EAL domain-containing protein, partial [Thiohalocapsa sp.]
SGLKAEIRYSPLLALSARVRPARRYQVSAWLPNDVQVDPDAAPLAPRPATDPVAERSTEDSDRAHWLDSQSMERALDELAADRNNRGAVHDPKPLRLFVPQSIATVIHREWVLWMRDRLLERQLLGYAPLVVLRAEDLLAHLGVASALFRLLEQLQVEVCLERLNTEPATLSLLTSFPLAYAAVDPALLQAKESRTPLIKLVDAAHAQHVPLIASDIDDEETLARVRQCGVDLVAGTFIQAPSISMDFAFEPCGEGA